MFDTPSSHKLQVKQFATALLVVASSRSFAPRRCNHLNRCGIITFTQVQPDKLSINRRSSTRSETGKANGLLPSRRKHPAPQHPSSPPAARTAGPSRRGRTRDPATTSAEPRETQTLARTTDGMDASRGQFADHRPDRAKLTARDNAGAESFWATVKSRVLRPIPWAHPHRP